MATMLDDRKTAILAAVVQEYIATAQPVGSGSVARTPSIGVSSATVRSELAVLEQEGFLVQPHTSAGRIPTDKGYRYFVDHLTTPGRLDRTTQRPGRGVLLGGPRPPRGDAAPDLEPARRTHPQRRGRASGRGPRRWRFAACSWSGCPMSAATVVVVFANGSVEHVTLDSTDGDDDDRLAAASAHLSIGARRRGARRCAAISSPPAMRPSTGCVRAALERMHTIAAADHVYTGGASEVARAFDAVEVVRSVLHTLEQQFVVVSLVSDIVNRGMSVAIGVEHGVEPLSACSVVVAPVVVEGEHLGSVGVLGPTRMNYPQALATVDVVSEQLGHRIEEG